VRPLRLEVEGFTSFREKASVSFEDLDLFAITGPTGSGKSSLIDALVFALYGQVPRVGKEYKQLISQGSERLSVRLDFEAGGRRYRVVRSAKAAGAPQTRLEEVFEAGPQPLADRVRDIEAQIGAILGLDYDAFVRSVVLPQGQFDAFLKGEPKERRKILVALLNLGVYEDMQRLANARAARARDEAGFIARQLATDFAGATAEALAERRRDLEAAVRAAADADLRAASLAEGLRLAVAVRAARERASAAASDRQAEQGRLARGEAALATAHEEGLRRAEQAGALEKRRAALAFAPERHAGLAVARDLGRQLVEQRGAEARQAAERRTLEKQRLSLEKAVAAAEAALERTLADESEATAASEVARAERDVLHTRHAAHAVRALLRPGEPCPVCEQTVKKVPKGRLPALSEVETRLRAAEELSRRTRSAAQEARVVLERQRADLRVLEGKIDAAARRGGEAGAGADALARRLDEAGFPVGTGDLVALLDRIEREWRAQDEARAGQEALEREARALHEERARIEVRIATAREQVVGAQARLSDLAARLAEAEREVAVALADLRERARAETWTLPTEPAANRDEAATLEALLAAAQQRARETTGLRGSIEAQIQHLERAAARACELAARQKQLEAEAALAGALAQHLKADQFIGYVLEEALGVLADDGTTHLRELSAGRYSLACRGQEFLVIDHWNADGERSVKTLSGGESFLASLALAMALAERLATLSAQGRAGEALESLFLDEGFGTLDRESLDAVVQALDALHGGRRMVGIVTHLAELADRLPARVQVARSGSTSTVAVS
jgi:DNA repair protein SbcC/Rad50